MMKTIFDQLTYNEVLGRLGQLAPDSTRQWGKMSPSQAMEHTARVLEMATSEKQPVKQILLGKALSWIFMKKFLGEEPFRKNAPTGPDYKITDQPDFDATREKLSALMTKFHDMGESGLDGNVHPFFGQLTGKQWGETQYKHLDHHLRQFDV